MMKKLDRGDGMKKMGDNNFKATTKSLFLKYAITPNLIVIILFSVFTILLLNIKTVYDTKKSANNIENKVSRVYDTYADEMERMIHLPQVIDTLETKQDNHLVYEEFYNFNTQNDVQGVFHLIDPRDVFLVSTTPSVGENNRKIIEDMLPFIEENPDDIYMNAERTELSNGKSTVLNFGTAIKNDRRTMGYLIYQLYEEDFQELIFGENADIAILTDYYDYVIATTNSITTGLMNKFHPDTVSKTRVKIKDDEYYMNKLRMDDQLFTIYTMNNVKSYWVIYLLYLTFIIVIGIVMYFLLTNMAERMSSKNVASIEKLMEAVSQLEQGDMTAYVNIDTNDEFELLANQYNDMLVNLNRLLKRNEELSDIRKSKEIKLLESQFNPHFVFNVLETLRYTMFVDTDKAQEIIFSLARVLRYSLHANTHEVPFEKDLNYILDYLKLHKWRFGDRLEYEIDVEDAVVSETVPKLLIQPLIENAIKYGYQNQANLSIIIQGRIVDGTIVFTVSDNGQGMSPEKLHDIRAMLYSQETEPKAETGIGLYNTHRRIVLQYGDAYGVTIESTLNEGTEVTIKLPYLQGTGD